MGVSVKFGTYSGDVNTIHKTTSLGAAVTCELKQPTTVEAPYFIVDSGSVSNTATYCQCENFGRYYYIQQVDELPGHQKGVQCVVDPLKSFASAICNIDFNISRYEGSTESELYDGAVTKLAQCEPLILSFGGGNFSKIANNSASCYVLMVAN